MLNGFTSERQRIGARHGIQAPTCPHRCTTYHRVKFANETTVRDDKWAIWLLLGKFEDSSSPTGDKFWPLSLYKLVRPAGNQPFNL